MFTLQTLKNILQLLNLVDVFETGASEDHHISPWYSAHDINYPVPSERKPSIRAFKISAIAFLLFPHHVSESGRGS